VTELPDNATAPNVPVPSDGPGAPLSVWPTLIGLSSIGIAVVNLLPCLLAVIVAPQGPYGHTVPGVGLGLFSFVLLPAGIRTLQRRRSAGDLHILHAGMYLLVWAAVILQGSYYSSGLTTGLKALMTGQMPPSLIPEFLSHVAWLLWIVLLAAHAVFLLAWFLRPAIKAQVAAWPYKPNVRDKSGGAS